ncbi:MAG: hypothetical protein ABIB71_03380, partial [Candidatus Woesearchaeota archaeon]
MAIVYSSALGTYVFEGNKIIDKLEFSLNQSLRYCQDLAEGKQIQPEAKLCAKHNAKPANKGEFVRVLELLATPEYIEGLRKVALRLMADQLKASVSMDNLIINAINNIEELDKVANTLAKRAREWYSLYFPEASELIKD